MLVWVTLTWNNQFSVKNIAIRTGAANSTTATIQNIDLPCFQIGSPWMRYPLYYGSDCMEAQRKETRTGIEEKIEKAQQYQADKNTMNVISV